MVTFTSTPFSIRLSGSDFISQRVYVAFSDADLLFWDFFADAALFLSLRLPASSSVSDESSGALPASPHQYNVYICGHINI